MAEEDITAGRLVDAGAGRHVIDVGRAREPKDWFGSNPAETARFSAPRPPTVFLKNSCFALLI